MRYAKPRKLQTKRGQQRAEANAWCVGCRQPMARHGKNFTCSTCHVACRIQLTPTRRAGVKCRFGGQGRVLRKNDKRLSEATLGNPYCLSCRVKMKTHGFRKTKAGPIRIFTCSSCGGHVSHIKAVIGDRVLKEQKALEML